MPISLKVPNIAEILWQKTFGDIRPPPVIFPISCVIHPVSVYIINIQYPYTVYWLSLKSNRDKNIMLKMPTGSILAGSILKYNCSSDFLNNSMIESRLKISIFYKLQDIILSKTYFFVSKPLRTHTIQVEFLNVEIKARVQWSLWKFQKWPETVFIEINSSKKLSKLSWFRECIKQKIEFEYCTGWAILNYWISQTHLLSTIRGSFEGLHFSLCV